MIIVPVVLNKPWPPAHATVDDTGFAAVKVPKEAMVFPISVMFVE